MRTIDSEIFHYEVEHGNVGEQSLYLKRGLEVLLWRATS